MYAEELATLLPTTIDGASPLKAAAELMREHRVHHLPVVDDGQLVGMLSSKDFRGERFAANECTEQGNRSSAFDGSAGEACHRTLITLPGNARLERVAWTMLQKQVHSIVLLREERPVGIVTDNDLFRKLLTHWREPWKRDLVCDYMSPSPTPVSPDMCLAEATSRMDRQRCHHAPVIREDGMLLGILSDEACASRSRFSAPSGLTGQEDLTVRDVMNRQIVSVGKYDRLDKAGALMLDRLVSGLLVLEFELVGILTRSDLLRAVIAAAPRVDDRHLIPLDAQ